MECTTRVLALLVALAGVANAATLPAATPTELPRSARPVHYDIVLEPDAKALTFNGTVSIDVEIVAPTRSLTLHSHELTFKSITLTPASGGRPMTAPSIDPDVERQTVTFTFERMIDAGRHRLVLDYAGKIGTQAAGLFAIDYDSPEGARRALYTQLAISNARMVIPSWDEPAYKATFSLQATVPAAHMAVGNMPIERRTDMGGGRVRVEFERTPSMSTYLLFFAVGDFERVTTRVGGTELGIVTRKGAKAQAAFALESSVRALREFNDYFGVPYPLPKLDNVAVPGSSRSFAAMENWGAILTFESVILLDPTISTQADRQNTFSIAAHEVSHQWFGNLVTMRWWDDTWLNEGFAQWMASRTMARLHPEWDTALDVVASREVAIGFDALATTHPIVRPVRTANEANQMFDAITYLKGEAVVEMLEGYVGDDAWRDGVRRYIKAHLYGSTVSDDLWRHVEMSAQAPVTAVAHDFILQPGVPLIRAEADACKDGRTRVRLAQSEFTKDRPDKPASTWRVPVIVKSLAGPNEIRQLVANGSASVDVPGCDPVIVNAGQSGYYRTLYAPAQFSAVADHFTDIAPIDQLGILADSWALGLTGHQPATDFFVLANATPADANPLVWERIADVFAAVDAYYRDDHARRERFREFAIARLRPVLARVGWTPAANEMGPVKILRSTLLEALSALGDSTVIAEARRRYAGRQADATLIPAELRKSILGVVARHADGKTWEALRNEARAEKTPLVRAELYTLLAATADPVLAQRTLDLAVAQEPGATISGDVFAEVARLHPDLAFDFAVVNLAKINELLDANSRTFFVPFLGRASNDPAMPDKIMRFTSEHIPADARSFATSFAAEVTDRVRVRKDRLPAIGAWLERARP